MVALDICTSPWRIPETPKVSAPNSSLLLQYHPCTIGCTNTPAAMPDCSAGEYPTYPTYTATRFTHNSSQSLFSRRATGEKRGVYLRFFFHFLGSWRTVPFPSPHYIGTWKKSRKNDIDIVFQNRIPCLKRGRSRSEKRLLFYAWIILFYSRNLFFSSSSLI